ncbi:MULTISPECIES: BON domain-containing protein [Rubrivivax]|uniref:BON domain-containing protein n=1 Tax=Rubrivivax benzoatilyticus TaxID=316997 RepID=A0ABX0HV54_9BURK|nr:MULTISPECIES: BON domain-containing protein [Rubrivivax]EGJ12516.1 osmotically inducible periplasmic protein [Rubrivivax benzoatilyticus JA2 = ATCC BAA-35]MCD0421439.1 BON domain-containing protein [Rubrivivax sp. JA1024]NHK98191.1 BON domain-containing protein [Rubrivivax benzoatilyticus]NHL24034.1 BON domain-containing protein [Rubrivivax benzoatilyticus]
MNTPRRPLAATVIAAAVAALALTACGRQDEQTAGEKLDSATAAAGNAAERAGNAIENAAERTGEAIGNASERAGAAIDDATVTARVNAELAKDPDLSALRIDVDTESGRVVLKGSAPDVAARERATQIAARVDGVKGVDNRLEVKS